jgi:hypothetical protein
MVNIGGESLRAPTSFKQAVDEHASCLADFIFMSTGLRHDPHNKFIIVEVVL